MSKLERLKEQLAYLKFWQGVMVVTDISLVGWLDSTAWSCIARLSIVLIRSGDYSHGNYCRYRHARRRIRVCRHRT